MMGNIATHFFVDIWVISIDSRCNSSSQETASLKVFVSFSLADIRIEQEL